MYYFIPSLILICLACWLGCGSEDDKETTVPSVYTEAIAEPSFAEANAILLASCAGATCHNGQGSQMAYIDNPTLVEERKNTLITEIEAGRMPKGKSLSAADKETLLNYLNNITADNTTDTSTDTSSAVDNPTWTQYNALAATNCSGASCHSGTGGQQAYVDNESLVTTRKNNIITELNAGRMPKNQSISATDKQTMLNYLNGL